MKTDSENRQQKGIFGGIFINTSLELTRLLITSTFTKRNNILAAAVESDREREHSSDTI